MEKTSDVYHIPNVSIVVPVYNSIKYIEKTTESIVSQAFNNYEVIIVDDGSNDNSAKVAEEILKQYSISYQLITQKNMGLSGARNTGIRNSKGKYICFVDSDDIIHPAHLSTMFSLAEENDLKLVCCDYEETHDDNRSGNQLIQNENTIISGSEFTKVIINRKPPIFVCGILILREELFKYKLFFNEKLRFGEDSDYLLRLLNKFDRVGLTQKQTYKYLNRNDSIMKTITVEQGELFLEEFKRTFTSMVHSSAGECSNQIRIAYNRELLGFVHSFAMCASYEDFMRVVSNIDSTSIFTSLKRVNSKYARLYSALFKIDKRLTYRFTNLYHACH